MNHVIVARNINRLCHRLRQLNKDYYICVTFEAISKIHQKTKPLCTSLSKSVKRIGLNG
jgi:hypothetical protein